MLIRAAQLIGRDGLERANLASIYGHLVLLAQSSDLDIARLVRDKVSPGGQWWTQSEMSRMETSIKRP